MLRFLPGGFMGVMVVRIKASILAWQRCHRTAINSEQAISVSRLISKVPTYLLFLVGEICLVGTLTIMSVPVPTHVNFFAYSRCL
jgi:hypothetical protein